MRRAWAVFLAACISAVALADDDVISHRVLNREVSAGGVPSFDVEVQPIGDRLPSEEELGALSNHLVQGDSRNRKFVLFYLPGMAVGSGAYATAHHEPDMTVNVMPFMLIQYPEYKEYLPEELQGLLD